MLTFLAEIEAGHWPVVAHYSRPNQSFVAAFWAMWLLAGQISVIQANRKCWRDRDVRQAVILDHLAHQAFAGLTRTNFFAHVEMQYRSSGVFALQRVLQLQRLKRIFGEANGQLAAVGVVNIFAGI